MFHHSRPISGLAPFYDPKITIPPPKLYDNYESATSVAVGTAADWALGSGVSRECVPHFITVLKSKMERQACKAREEEEIHTSHEEPK